MERLMQYIWAYRLLRPGAMRTVDGLSVSIIDPGRLNTGSGPDFFNAKIDIGGHMWAGDVEIHVRASDWHRHGHDHDKAYDSVILHVVGHDDTMICRSNGEVIPQMILPAKADFANHYNNIVSRADRDLPCRAFIGTLDAIVVRDFVDALAMERLYAKADRIMGYRAQVGNDWRELFYVTLARGLGFGTNAEPFQRLAIATPYRLLARHADDLTIIEAALLGQSGLLEGVPSDNGGYVDTLRREYGFILSKFGLKPPVSLNWKMGRMRPGNLPYRRVAYLASYVSHLHRQIDAVINCTSVEEMVNTFEEWLSGFWATHYTFTTEALRGGDTRLSASSMRTLAINVGIPFAYAYHTHRGDDQRALQMAELLHDLPPESNTVVSMFASAGIKCDDAFATQAVIELRRNYCEARKCLFCRFGHRMLARHATSLA